MNMVCSKLRGPGLLPRAMAPGRLARERPSGPHSRLGPWPSGDARPILAGLIVPAAIAHKDDHYHRGFYDNVMLQETLNGKFTCQQT